MTIRGTFLLLVIILPIGMGCGALDQQLKIYGSGSTTPTPPAEKTTYIYLASENSTASQIHRFLYDSKTKSISFMNSWNATNISGASIRGMTLGPSGQILVGGGSVATGYAAGNWVDSTLTSSTNWNGTSTGSHAENLHGVCSLPNGNLILGEYDAAKKAYEYTSSGSFLREVYATSEGSGVAGMGDCYAVSNDEVLISVVDTWASFDYGKVIRLVRQPDQSWAVSGNIFSQADYNSANTLNLNLWAFAVHTNGRIYLPSWARTNNGANAAVTQLVECSSANLLHSNCSLVGQTIASGDTGRIDSIAQVSGTNDLIYVTQNKLYRYDYSTGVSSVLYTLSSLTDHVLTRKILVLQK